MTHPPTGEQEAILDAFKAGDQTLVVEALAGTGKTTTLRFLAAVDTRRPTTYLAYNKAIVKEAEGRFPQSTSIGTAHSFAYRAIGHAYSHRLPGARSTTKRMYARDVAKLLKTQPVSLPEHTLSAVQVVRLAEAMITKFCQSGDLHFTIAHIPHQAHHLGTLHELFDALHPTAVKIWRDIENTTGRLYFTHDHYLKLWQLSNPTLPGEVVFFDEAQDANPVVASIIANQRNHQLVYVGDRNQQLYAWRNAIDAMAKVDGKRLALTKSFRFGPAIAEAANEWLEMLGSPHMLVGHEPVGSRIAPLAAEATDALLCRTNGTALTAILEAQEIGVRVAMAPGDKSAGKDILAFARGVQQLKDRGSSDHPDLMVFKAYHELLQYVEEEEGGKDLERLVKVIERVGTTRVMSAILNLVPKAQAQLTVSTAHKAKGLEWDRVKIANDFTPPNPDEDEKTDLADLQVAYVAVTRAIKTLDPGPLGDPGLWRDCLDYTTALGLQPQGEQARAELGF